MHKCVRDHGCKVEWDVLKEVRASGAGRAGAVWTSSAHGNALRPALRYKPAANTAWRHWQRRGMNSEMSSPEELRQKDELLSPEL